MIWDMFRILGGFLFVLAAVIVALEGTYVYTVPRGRQRRVILVLDLGVSLILVLCALAFWFGLG